MELVMISILYYQGSQTVSNADSFDQYFNYSPTHLVKIMTFSRIMGITQHFKLKTFVNMYIISKF